MCLKMAAFLQDVGQNGLQNGEGQKRQKLQNKGFGANSVRARVYQNIKRGVSEEENPPEKIRPK